MVLSKKQDYFYIKYKGTSTFLQKTRQKEPEKRRRNLVKSL